MKKVTRIICVIAFCLVAMMGMSSVSSADEKQYTDNVIPEMTSNTSPSGTATASGVWNGDGNNYYEPYKAFDHTLNSWKGAWASSTYSGWLAYEFPVEKCITKYTLVSRSQPPELLEMPKDWTFEAWDAQLNKWIILDTRSNVTDWIECVKKDFTFTNSKSYKKYRINVTHNGLYNGRVLVIGEMEMMETNYSPSTLLAEAGNKNIRLKWEQVYGATGYVIKYGTSATDLNKTKNVVNNATYTMEELINGTKYYFTVSAIVNGVEKEASNVASATPKANSDYEGNSAIIEIVMTNGTIKEYSLTNDELESFLTWYDNRSDGVGKSYYRIPKKSNVKPFLSRKEYLSFDKIYSFEVKDYNE